MNITTKKSLLATMVGLFAATGGLQQAYGQDGEGARAQSQIDEIIVTASKRATSLQDTALSVSAISGADLDKLGVTNFAQILGTIPGVTVPEFGSGYTRASFRGIATDTAVGGNATVSTYINDFPLQLGSRDIKMVDMAHVEVLKGPQGTLYGQSAMGGVMRFITNKPAFDAISGGVNMNYESVADGNAGYEGQGYVNIPLSDSLAVRGVFYNYDSAGFIDNLGTGSEDTNTEEVTGGRLALRWDISDRAAFNLLYLNQASRLGGGQALDGPTASSTYTPVLSGAPTDIAPPDPENPSYISNIDPFADFDFEALNLQLNVNFDGFDLSLMGATKQNEWQRVSDISLWFGLYDDVTTLLDRQYVKDDATTLEGRLVSTGDGPIEWIVGVWYEKLDRVNSWPIEAQTPRTDLFGGGLQDGGLAFDRLSFNDTEELAVYGEVGYRFTDKAKFTLGYRRADLKLDSGVLRAGGLFDGGFGLAIGVDESTQEDINTYKIHFEYQFNDDILAYALASSGYRSGGFNRSGFGGLSPASAYGTDTLWNYELGVRTSWLDNRLTANAVAYYIDWSDIQLRAWDVVALTNRIQNAGKAEVFGFETEIDYQVTDKLQLSVNYAYIDASLAEDYLDFSPTSPTRPISPTVIAAEGTRLPGSSRHSFSLFVDWQQHLTSSLDLLANANYRYVSSRPNILGLSAGLASAFPDDLPSADSVNLSVGVSHDSGVTASLFANNLFDERDVQAQRRLGTALEGIHISRPRTIGLRVGYQF